MPAQPFRQRAMKASCLQYDGTNKQEILDFAPDFVHEDESGNLVLERNPYPILATEWIVLDEFSNWNRMTDANFKIEWEHGQ